MGIGDRVGPRDIAHTNLRLYGQLTQQGWSEQDLTRVRAGYDLCLSVFGGRLRRNGNTFVAHVVGTASLCATYGGRPDVVLAAVLHAAYTAGDFGDARRLLNEGQRTIVREAIGSDAEALIVAFAHQLWKPGTVADFTARADALSDTERDVVFMRLANEVEQQLDFGSQYQTPRDDYPTGAAMIALAEARGHLDIAIDLKAVFDADEAFAIDPAFRPDESPPAVVPPRAYAPRHMLRLQRLYFGALRRLRRAMGRRSA